jgi:hypothetical protein
VGGDRQRVLDLLTGAITAAHRVHLDPAAAMHSGKRLAIARAAEVLGWTDLVCDTMPGSPFNIWHFPIGYRATPTTRSVGPIRKPRHVTKADLQGV